MSANFETVEIALNKLVLWDGNVRKTGGEAGLDELAASIAAHGLMNPLTVREAAKGKFAVVAGGRRLRALQMLAKDRTLTKAAPVSCHLIEADTDAAELSLAENVVRVAMHPADQFEAWRGLIEDGQTVPEVAVRFGVAESTVRKRLALGRVSPVILQAYRDGQTDLETLQAFTVTDDQAVQEALWQGLSGWQRTDARMVRRALTEGDVPTSDRRVRFVGLDAYANAGGAVKRDLFAAEGEGFCVDVTLLDRLTQEKLQAVADTVKAEGWAWTEARVSFGWDERQALGRAEPERLDDALLDEREGLEAVLDDLAYSDDPDDQTRLEAAEKRLAEIEALAETWSAEVKAYAGAVVSLSHQGEAVIERGLIREDDAPEVEDEEAEAEGSEPEGDATPALPAALIEDLTAHKTAALRVELARRPDVALSAIVHALALSAFYRSGERGLKGGLTIRSLERSIQGHDEAPAVLALEAEAEAIGERLPGNPQDLWDWCLSADRDTLLDVLAVAAAYGVDAVVTKGDPNRSGVALGNALAQAVNLDMAAWYRPTARRYFGRINKALILSDLRDAKGVPPAPAWAKMKKAELAALAERETASSGWLPEPLR